LKHAVVWAVARGWLLETKHGRGKTTEWTLAPDGAAIVKPGREDI
jgi:hypothetical protein